MSTRGNRELTKEFNQLYPGGHTNFRIPLEATENRVFLKKAEGSRVWDVEGNEYIDFMGAMGPGLLGHRHPEYTASLQRFMDEMSTAVGSGILFTPDDIDVANKIIRHVPCAEKVKFCTTGSEAVQMAIRLARAHTGRSLFIRFGGHYHGWFDNILGGALNTDTTELMHAVEDPFNDVCYTEGRDAGALKQSFMLPWNDADTLERVLEAHGEKIAIIHMEALVCNHFCKMPKPGFLEKVRALCDHYGIVMSIDEVITGFRVGLSGAQGMFGVTPDLATFGKAIAGGVPFSAVVGKSEILDLLKENKVLGPGTFNGYPLGMRAVLTTLEILERDNGAAYDRMSRIQEILMNGLQEIAQRRGVPMRIQGATGVFFTLFGLDPDQAVYTDADMAAFDVEMLHQFWVQMQALGIIVLAGGRWYMSLGHTRADVDKTLEAADQAMANLC